MFEDNVSTYYLKRVKLINARLMLIYCWQRRVYTMFLTHKTCFHRSRQSRLRCGANDVYSANGTVLLIEKGSTVFGEFRNGQIQQGEERYLWFG